MRLKFADVIDMHNTSYDRNTDGKVCPRCLVEKSIILKSRTSVKGKMEWHYICIACGKTF